MNPPSPHYLLFSEASRHRRSDRTWRFVLQNVESRRRFTATDTEPTDCGERLELLAVVRGLEALEGPARVTLVTKSRYVSRGMKSGLAEWRASDWQWERFGRVVPVRDSDLWKRVDRALRFHQVDCQTWQFDEDLSSAEQPGSATAPKVVASTRRKVRAEPRAEPRAKPRAGRVGIRGGVARTVHWPDALRALLRPMRQAFGAVAHVS